MLKTVNVESVDLVIHRVNDRILSQYDPSEGESGLEGQWSSDYEASGRRVEVWSGEVDVDSIRNEVVETAFDLKDKISELGAGAYIVTARRGDAADDDYRAAKAWRWIISTDLALTSYSGADGLDVSVRSISTAGLASGVRLDLIAANNEQLAETVTDGRGRARFDAALLKGDGPLRAAMVMAYGADGDYAVLNLSRAPLDLTAMDVQGRDVVGPLDL